jgi:hypothetical protein
MAMALSTVVRSLWEGSLDGTLRVALHVIRSGPVDILIELGSL